MFDGFKSKHKKFIFLGGLPFLHLHMLESSRRFSLSYDFFIPYSFSFHSSQLANVKKSYFSYLQHNNTMIRWTIIVLSYVMEINEIPKFKLFSIIWHLTCFFYLSASVSVCVATLWLWCNRIATASEWINLPVWIMSSCHCLAMPQSRNNNTLMVPARIHAFCSVMSVWVCDQFGVRIHGWWWLTVMPLYKCTHWTSSFFLFSIFCFLLLILYFFPFKNLWNIFFFPFLILIILFAISPRFYHCNSN